MRTLILVKIISYMFLQVNTRKMYIHVYTSYILYSFQGCMNNITFGDDAFGHYETVAGGAGAVSIDRYRYKVIG